MQLRRGAPCGLFGAFSLSPIIRPTRYVFVFSRVTDDLSVAPEASGWNVMIIEPNRSNLKVSPMRLLFESEIVLVLERFGRIDCIQVIDKRSGCGT